MEADYLDITHVFFLYSVEGEPGGYPRPMYKIVERSFAEMRKQRFPDDNSSELPVYYWGAADPNQFEANLAKIREWAEDPTKDCCPLIHLYMHGNENGFGGQSLLMEWEQLNRELSLICKAADGNVILILSSCYGDSVVMKFLQSLGEPQHFPYYGFISARGKLGVLKGRDDYGRFYEAFFDADAGLNFNEAIEAGFDVSVAKHESGYVIDRTQDLYQRVLQRFEMDITRGLPGMRSRLIQHSGGALPSAELWRLLNVGTGWACREVVKNVPRAEIRDNDERAIAALHIDRWLARVKEGASVFYGEALKKVGEAKVNEMEGRVRVWFGRLLNSNVSVVGGGIDKEEAAALMRDLEPMALETEDGAEPQMGYTVDGQLVAVVYGTGTETEELSIGVDIDFEGQGLASLLIFDYLAQRREKLKEVVADFANDGFGKRLRELRPPDVEKPGHSRWTDIDGLLRDLEEYLRSRRPALMAEYDKRKE